MSSDSCKSSFDVVDDFFRGVYLRAPYKRYGTSLPMWANFVQNIKDETLSERRLKMIKQVVLGEMKRVAQVACGFWFDSIDGPIRVSAAVQPGHYSRDHFGNIVVNEQWALDHCWDSDGDRGMLMVNPETKEAIIVKYPITRYMEVLKFQESKVVEQFSDFDHKPAKLETKMTKERFRSYVNKAQYDPMTGLITNWVDAWELFAGNLRGLSGDSMRDFLGTLDTRINMIEKSGLQINRKEGLDGAAHSFDTQYVLPDFAHMLLHKRAPAMEDVLLSMELKEMQDAIWNLSFEIEERPLGEPRPLKDPEIKVYRKERLFNKLIKIGMLDLKPIPHLQPGFEAITVTVRNKNGHPCALRSVKRDKIEINYCMTILPQIEVIPRWIDVDGNQHENHEVMEVEGELLTTDGIMISSISPNSEIKWWNPQELLIRALGKVFFSDNTYNEWLDDGVSFWHVLGKNPSLGSQITRVLEEVCGKLGYTAVTVKGQPNPMTIEMSRRVMTVDYHTRSAVKKVEIAEFVNWHMKQFVNGMAEAGVEAHYLALCGGQKGSSNPVQKHGLADKDLKPIWAKSGTDPKRTDEIKSQAANSHYCGKGYVFITGESTPDMTVTEGQMFATPAGIALQSLDFPLFMPQVVDPELEKGAEVHKYPDLLGNIQTVHLKNSRQTTKYGKILLNEYACKNMLAPLPTDLEAMDQDGNKYPIHFVMSQAEFKSKGALDSILEHALVTYTTVRINGRDVYGALVKPKIFRTLNTSENIMPGPATHRACRFSSHLIQAGINRLGVSGQSGLIGEGYRRGDEEYFAALREFYLQVNRLPVDIHDLGTHS